MCILSDFLFCNISYSGNAAWTRYARSCSLWVELSSTVTSCYTLEIPYILANACIHILSKHIYKQYRHFCTGYCI